MEMCIQDCGKASRFLFKIATKMVKTKMVNTTMNMKANGMVKVNKHMLMETYIVHRVKRCRHDLIFKSCYKIKNIKIKTEKTGIKAQ